MSVLDQLLDSVDWGRVTHGYGAATDTPLLLAALLNSDHSAEALDKLFDSINHQGSQSEAGLFACPYLLELIKDTRLPNLQRILDLILGIAVGLPDDYLLSGEKITSSFRLPCPKSKASRWQLSERRLRRMCYAAARLGIGQFIALLDHRDSRVAWQAAYTLAWFPGDSSRVLPNLRRKLEDARSGSPKDFANFLLPTGLLEWQSGRKRVSEKNVREYLASCDRLTRYAAAVYLGWFCVDDEVRRVLSELSHDQEFDSRRRDENVVVFNNGDLADYAERLLDRVSDR